VGRFAVDGLADADDSTADTLVVAHVVAGGMDVERGCG
jgi:hypothetical protein